MRHVALRPAEAGATLLELLIVVAIVGVLSSVAVPAFSSALERARRSALVADGKALYEAMTRFHVDHGEFPSTFTPPTRFDRRTLEPLVRTGYLRNAWGIRGRLLDGEVTAYDSPDVGGGANREFWAVLTCAADPALRLLVASTENYPGKTGSYDGLYWIVAADLTRVR